MMLALIFFIGLAVGSFVNVLIDRLPEGESVLWGRSHCDFCKKTLRWYELIPLFSYLFQLGRCRRCHKRLSPQYPIIELVTAIGFVILYSSFSYSLTLLLSYYLIFISLLVIFVADLKTFIIPDSMVVLGLVGATLRFLEATRFSLLAPSSQLLIANYILSAFGVALFFLGLWVITKKKGIGLGDVKLAFLLGLLLGFPHIVIALYIAFLTGALVGVILILRGKKSLKSHVPFGPFLILGYIGAVVYGNQLYQLWNHFV